MKKKKNIISSQPVTVEKINLRHVVVLALIVIFGFLNIFPNDFTLIDDYGTFVNNPVVHNFGASLKTVQIQIILYSIFYHLFGLSTIPVHVLSLLLHLANVLLVYRIFTSLFKEEASFIASLLFAVHPIVTEAVVWISGNPYLFNACLMNASILFYIRYRKSGLSKYLIWSMAVFIGGLIFFQNVWLVILPALIFIVDQIYIRKRFSFSGTGVVLIYFIPVVFYIVFSMIGQIDYRVASREGATPLNQQALKPVVEGIPYTISTMVRLYLFPDKLMIYYDGNPITPLYYYGMYVGFLIYILALLFSLKYYRQLFGVLVLLIVSMAPTMSPFKLVWFMSERYLYYGTAFFTLGIALLFTRFLNHRLGKQVIMALVFFIVLVYFIRTQYRIVDYRDTETIAKATIKTSPLGLRGWDDLANSYLIKGDYKKAIPIYYHSLSLVPDANTPVSNLGLIYLQFGIPLEPNLQPPIDKRPAQDLYNLGYKYFKENRETNAAFYLYQSIRKDPSNPNSYVTLAEVNLRVKNYKQAEELLGSALKIIGPDIRLYNKLAYAVSWQGKYDLADIYLQKALEIDGRDPETLSNAKQLNGIRLRRGMQAK